MVVEEARNVIPIAMNLQSSDEDQALLNNRRQIEEISSANECCVFSFGL